MSRTQIRGVGGEGINDEITQEKTKTTSTLI